MFFEIRFSSTVGAQPRQRDMSGIKFEAVQGAHPVGDAHQQIGGQIDDASALPTLSVKVRTAGAGEVISGGAMSQVDVLHHAELAQRSQRSIHTGAVHLRCDFGDCRRDLLSTQMARRGGECGEHRPARGTHAFALGAQLNGDSGQQGLGIRVRAAR